MVTNSMLDKFPVNCGNCLQMKIAGRRDKTLFALCARGHLTKKYWIDGENNNPLPKKWDEAKRCVAFDSTIPPPETKEVPTWKEIAQKHL